MNQRIGNPDLKQSFTQQFYLSYNASKLLAQRYLYGNINFSTVSNDFSTINFVDQLGRKISQPLNVQGNNSLSFYGGYSKTFTKPALRINVDVFLNRNHNTNYINALKNITNSINVSLGPRFVFAKDKNYDFTYAPRITLTRSTNSIRTDQPTKYITQEHFVYFSIVLPLKFEFVTDCIFSLRQKTDAFDKNTNAIKWNARIDKKLLKKDAAILRFAAFDMLDQNIGSNEL